MLSLELKHTKRIHGQKAEDVTFTPHHRRVEDYGRRGTTCGAHNNTGSRPLPRNPRGGSTCVICFVCLQIRYTWKQGNESQPQLPPKYFRKGQPVLRADATHRGFDLKEACRSLGCFLSLPNAVATCLCRPRIARHGFDPEELDKSPERHSALLNAVACGRACPHVARRACAPERTRRAHGTLSALPSVAACGHRRLHSACRDSDPEEARRALETL